VAYIRAFRLAWFSLVGVGLVLSFLLPGHLVAALGVGVAACTSFLLHPRQPWWGYRSAESGEPPPKISVWRSLGAFTLGLVVMSLAVGVGWFIIGLWRFGT
jgi:hypothetical protein